MKHIKKTTPRILEKCILLINNTKTADYDITRNGDDKWKTCKLLRSLLDTEKDIIKRKILIDGFTLRKDFVILQLYWWLFSSTKHCG